MEIKQGKNRFYIGNTEEDFVAEITYEELDDKTWSINHTYVDPSLEGQGIGRKLVQAVKEAAFKQDKKLSATCSYAAHVLQKSAEK